MAFTVRLNPELERKFAAACRLRGTTKNAMVRQLIMDFVHAERSKKSSFEIAQELGLVGCCDSAPAPGRDHSASLKAQLRKELRSRFAARHTR